MDRWRCKVPPVLLVSWIVLLLLLQSSCLTTSVLAQSSTETSTDASTTSTNAVTTATTLAPTTTSALSPPPNTTTAAGGSSTSAPAVTTTTTTVAPTPVPTPVPVVGTPSPTNVTVASQTIEYPVIIGGGVVIFALVIGACYVTFMWQQKALRLYKATYEETIKDRGRARRDIENVFLMGENRVFDYAAQKEGDADEEIISDLSPVAMRARILGQQYTAAKYVEKKQAHPLTVAPSPATYVGRGPVYYPPTQYRSQNRDEEETGGHLFGDDHEMTVIRPAPVTTTTPPLKPQLFDGMTMRGGRTNNNASFRSDASTTLRLTDDSSVSRADDASSVSDSRRTNSSDAQRRIVEQALLVHNSIQELRGHSALRNMNTASMW